ncbi:hypothetical protein WJ977_24115 [Achromobacter xylosoxidans]
MGPSSTTPARPSPGATPGSAGSASSWRCSSTRVNASGNGAGPASSQAASGAAGAWSKRMRQAPAASALTS